MKSNAQPLANVNVNPSSVSVRDRVSRILNLTGSPRSWLSTACSTRHYRNGDSTRFLPKGLRRGYDPSGANAEMTTDTAPPAEQWRCDILELEGEKRIQRVVETACSVLPDNRLKMNYSRHDNRCAYVGRGSVETLGITAVCRDSVLGPVGFWQWATGTVFNASPTQFIPYPRLLQPQLFQERALFFVKSEFHSDRLISIGSGGSPASSAISTPSVTPTASLPTISIMSASKSNPNHFFPLWMR